MQTHSLSTLSEVICACIMTRRRFKSDSASSISAERVCYQIFLSAGGMCESAVHPAGTAHREEINLGNLLRETRCNAEHLYKVYVKRSARTPAIELRIRFIHVEGDLDDITRADHRFSIVDKTSPLNSRAYNPKSRQPGEPDRAAEDKRHSQTHHNWYPHRSYLSGDPMLQRAAIGTDSRTASSTAKVREFRNRDTRYGLPVFQST